MSAGVPGGIVMLTGGRKELSGSRGWGSVTTCDAPDVMMPHESDVIASGTSRGDTLEFG